MNDYNRPEIDSDGHIIIEDGRHPVVEKMITGERFVPNSIRVDDIENQVLIITGPNMAGKSTVLRQVALLVLMAQMGSFVPAGKASINITDNIYPGRCSGQPFPGAEYLHGGNARDRQYSEQCNPDKASLSWMKSAGEPALLTV